MEVLSWNAIAEERVNEHITRKMFWGENLMMARFELTAGSVIPLHDHLSEQLTTVLEGSVTLSFPGEASITLRKGEMVLIPASKPHGSVAGSEGCIALDIFSPIRQDFIDAKGTDHESPEVAAEAAPQPQDPEPASDPYERLHGILAGVGIRVPLEELRQMPLDLLARYVYEKECITMGELRRILGFSKEEAKGLLRQWKHGDDHSESSLKRKMERLIVLPSEFKLFRPE